MLQRNKVVTSVSAPNLQYFKGSKQIEWRQAEGADDKWETGLLGFAIEAYRYGEELDAACEKAGMAQVVVLHTFNQKPTEKTYWWFGEDCELYPISTGPMAPTIGGLLKRHEETIQSGIAVRWPAEQRVVINGTEEVRKGMSSIYVRCYERLLLDHGYAKPVQVGIRGPLSVSFLNAFLDHVRVCEIADEMKRKKSGNDDDYVALIELSWKLSHTEKPEAVGKQQTSRVFPFRSLHPDVPDRQYLGGIYIKNGLRKKIEANLEQDFAAAVEWAREFAQNGQGEPGPEQDTPQNGSGHTGNGASMSKNAPVAVADDDIGEDDIPF